MYDLSKAFDSVSHDILLHKFTKLVIDNFWFKNYLCTKTQPLRMGNDMSSALQTHYGNPKGSVLGPILFTTYVNDFSEGIKDYVLIQYADDTQYLETDTINSLLQRVHNTEQTRNIK